MSPRVMEHPFHQLPCSTVQKFAKGETVYAHGDTSANFHLVMNGKVKLFRPPDLTTRSVLLDIYGANEFFGESAFIRIGHLETAEAMEDTRLMTWTVEEIDRLVPENPRLAIALIRFIVRRADEFERRIESFAVETIPARLARTLIRFSERFGNRIEDGTIHMIPFTHDLLAQYVGTSREMISEWMNEFRQQGLLGYTRRDLVVRPGALKSLLS